MNYEELQKQKKIVDGLENKKAEYYKALESLKEYSLWKSIDEEASMAKKNLESMEKQYKEEGLAKYNETNNIEPIPFIKIKMFTTLKYTVLR